MRDSGSNDLIIILLRTRTWISECRFGLYLRPILSCSRGATFPSIVAKVGKTVSDEDVTKRIIDCLDVVTCFVVVIS